MRGCGRHRWRDNANVRACGVLQCAVFHLLHAVRGCDRNRCVQNHADGQQREAGLLKCHVCKSTCCMLGTACMALRCNIRPCSSSQASYLTYLAWLNRSYRGLSPAGGVAGWSAAAVVVVVV